jgi:hemerythrin superfamily protein
MKKATEENAMKLIKDVIEIMRQGATHKNEDEMNQAIKASTKLVTETTGMDEESAFQFIRQLTNKFSEEQPNERIQI